MRAAHAHRNKGTPNNRAGFAIIELLVVCAILIILFVMFMGRGSVHFQKKQQALCRQNLQTIHIALQTYANENKDRFPADAFSKSSEEALAKLVPQYTTRTDAFTCPGTKESKLPPAQSINGRRISYAYLMGLTAKPNPDQWIMADSLADTKPHAVGETIFSPDGKGPGRNHDKFGGVIIFLDGRAEITRPQTKFPIIVPLGTKILNPSR
jgi:type II secretory pathway pseudopilin PulG